MKCYPEECKEYTSMLFSDKGREARRYLKDRYITVATAKFWELGFSPIDFIPQCYKDSDENFYKKMNGRITIPVYDSNGTIIGISGRSIYPNLKPKYMHYVFPTRSTLFGLWQNEKDIVRENAIIFAEGQFDIINAWQNGLRICVCTFGAHFSEVQYALASRYTDRINIMYDQDQAGIEGTFNSMKKNKTYGEVKVRSIQYLMNTGDDLDSWISESNAERVMAAVNFSQLDYVKSKVKYM